MSTGRPATQRVVALVPMRHHSERAPGKNYRPFGGRPLFHWILETLTSCPELAEVVVDTDSPTIREGCAREFPRVRLLDRPTSLAAGDVPMNEVLLHDVAQVPADLYLQTHSTNPLLRSETVSGAVHRFAGDGGAHDSLFSVTRRHVRLWDHQGRPVNHDPAVLRRTQDLAPVFEENSCLYLFTRDGLLRYRNRIGARPLMLEIDALEAWDIDEELDFRVAEALLSLRRGAS